MANMFFEHLNEMGIENIKLAKEFPGSRACFAGYDYRYKTDSEDNFYFGFAAHNNLDLLIDEINSRLTNISIDVVFKKPLLEYLDGKEFRTYDACNREEISFYLFTIKLSEQYTPKARYVLQLAIAQFIRIYCPQYNHYTRLNLKKKEELIEETLRTFNIAAGSYGTWISDNRCTLETFMRLNDTKKVNKATQRGFSYNSFPYSSSLMRSLKRVENEIEEIS